MPVQGRRVCCKPRPRGRPDPRPQFIECLSSELARLEAGKGAFVARFGAAGYESVAAGWREKLSRARAGEQRWGVYSARKPAAA